MLVCGSVCHCQGIVNQGYYLCQVQSISQRKELMPPVNAQPQVSSRTILPSWCRVRRHRCRNGYNLMMTAQGIINRPLFVPCTSALVMALKDQAQSVVDMVMVGQYTHYNGFVPNFIMLFKHINLLSTEKSCLKKKVTSQTVM